MALKFAVNNSLSAITTLPSSISGGALNLISTQTASSSASLEFTTGIDSTYDKYIFKIINYNPATDSQGLQFQVSTNGGSSYGVTMTTTWFVSYHNESGTDGNIGYSSSLDLAQSTGFQHLGYQTGNGSDESQSGTLEIYSPSSSTFVKHFISRISNYRSNNYLEDTFVAGYINSTSPVNAVKFKADGDGNFDGIIKMYGVS